MHTHYRWRSSSPGYHCPGKVLVEGRGVYCLNIGGVQIDEAVVQAFIAALEPAKLAATLTAAERSRSTAMRSSNNGVLAWNGRATQRRVPSAVTVPSIPIIGSSPAALSGSGTSLRALEAAKTELARRERERPRVLTNEERDHLLALGRRCLARLDHHTARQEGAAADVARRGHHQG